jgi:outer membrane protein W
VFEVFKFLTDYSGFTPYIGINVGFDNLKFTEESASHSLRLNKNIINPGLTFGWDILPGKTKQPFVLRTNLRWFPFEKLNVNDKRFSLNQIEYNVIQAVFYPSRLRKAKQMRD